VELAAPVKSAPAWSTSHFCVLNIPSENETQKHEHDRKHQLNASTAEQCRQAA
jgi:hypothetical protein